tara:strand:+ start:864 stop:3005 length:2142 start_codon:yes stop_codon:yes gene_type:complete
MEKQFVLKAKTAVKRVAAISAGATMMGATMMGAVAADLGDYPSPFVNNGELNGLVVVGSASSAGDIVGAGDLISTLTQATVSASSSTTVTEGGEDKEIGLDASLSSFGTLTDNEVAGLIDDEIEWNDTDIDVHEELVLGAAMTMLASGESNGEEEMGSDMYLGTTGTGFTYKYVFEDAINSGATDLISNLDSDEPLTIEILGTSVEITDMAASAFTYKLADEYSLFTGDSVTVDGKEVSLVNVASGSSANVVITVDGEQETVGSTSETVNGLKVQVSDTFYSDDLEDRFAVLRIGADLSKTATDGQAVELYGGDDTDSDNEYQWTISLAGANSYIGVEYDAISDELDDTWAPVGVGGAISMPNGYAAVTFDSMTTSNYVDVEINAGGSESVNDTTVDVWEFTASEEDGFYINSEEVDTVFLSTDLAHNANSVEATTVTWHYQDDDGDWHNVTASNNTEALQVQYKSGSYLEIVPGINVTAGINVTVMASNISGIDDDLEVYLGYDADGDTLIGNAEDEVAGEVQLGETDYSTREYDIIRDGGIILRDPDGNLQGKGSVEFSIPEEEVKANIIVSGPETTTTTQQFSSVTVNSVAGQSVIKLDTEVTDPASRNLILVGGPAVNRLTAQAMGLNYPTTGADSGVPEGAALIRMVENAFGGSNTALVVAGWDAEDTRAAASVLQNYRSYANQLDGKMEVKVSGTSVSAVGGDVATE